ncbi:MAG: peroxisome assembly protein (Peroxin-2) [Lichina confinis]|nr:MAG: peroxisome assembly protein (Peroxin-2) [Lichina confinis]
MIADAMSSAEFQLAQQRIAARRGGQDVRAHKQLGNQSSPSVEHTAGGLPFPLSRFGRTTSSSLASIRGREGTRPAFRVGQVDAELLDEELLELLKGQVGEGLKYFNSHVKDEWAPEVALALRAVIYKLSMWDHNTTYGAALQNLRYADSRRKSVVHAAPSRWQKGLYGLFAVGGRYAWTKWEQWLSGRESGTSEFSSNTRMLSKATSLVALVHSVAAFLSFMVFLVNGKYRTLLDRLLRLRLTPVTSQLRHEVSFEYMNRQLVWHAFTEFLLFVLPLVGINRWRRWLSKAVARLRSLLKPGDGQAQKEKEPSGQLSFLPERTCAICYESQNPSSMSETEVLARSGTHGGVSGSALTDITNPYEAIPCGCVYCFVCLAQSIGSEEGYGWTCLRCGTIVKECRPWSGDVLETAGDVHDEEDPAEHGHERGSHGGHLHMTEIDPQPEPDMHFG